MIVVEQVWGKQHAAWLLAIGGVKEGVTVMPAAGDNCVTMLYFNGVANYLWKHAVLEAADGELLMGEVTRNALSMVVEPESGSTPDSATVAAMVKMPGYTSVRPGYDGSVRLPVSERRASRVNITTLIKKPASAKRLPGGAALFQAVAALNPASIPRHQEQEQQQQQQEQEQE